jgi:formylglycine-generating enzyme required for sulfatase activity
MVDTESFEKFEHIDAMHSKTLFFSDLLDAFRMDATEVTQGAYRGVVGSNPSKFSSCGDDCPVEQVDWNQAKSYCERVGKRLPTEAEWEYAARAGTSTKWHWGDDESHAGEYAWYSKNSGNQTHAVGQKRANPWGLYDMAGNVWEWTADWKGDYSPGEQRNPTGPASGSYPVLRGGSWLNNPVALRSSVRTLNTPRFRGNGLGFRCVLSGP